MTKIGKNILKLSIITTLVSILIFIGSYFYIFKIIYSDLQSASSSTVKEASQSIDGDKLKAVISKNSMDSPEFKEIFDSMIRFKADKNVRYLYTFVKADDNNVSYVVDASIEDACALGEKYPLDEDMKKAFNGDLVSTNKIVTDEYGTFLSAYAPIKDSSGNIVAIVGADQDVALYQKIINILIRTTIIAMIIAILLSVLMAQKFSKKLNKNLKIIEDNLDKMAEGDLTNPIIINSNDEINTIAEYVDGVRKSNSILISKFKGNAETVLEGVCDLSAISNEMSASSDNVTNITKKLSNAAITQAESLHIISNNMLQFSGEVHNILGLTEDADSKVKDIDIIAKDGNIELQNLISQLSLIKGIFTNLNDKIDSLSCEIDKIYKITDIINGVADQTNLLALNAAIEASRAGEAGRGFSVVAEEIRKLSEQSKVSSQQINTMIKNISTNSKEAVNTTAEVSDKINKQINMIETTLVSFKSIIESIEIIVPKVEKIKDSAKNIDSEKDLILRKVGDLTGAAEETSNSAEVISFSLEEVNNASRKVAETAGELNGMAKNMMDQANKFKL